MSRLGQAVDQVADVDARAGEERRLLADVEAGRVDPYDSLVGVD